MKTPQPIINSAESKSYYHEAHEQRPLMAKNPKIGNLKILNTLLLTPPGGKYQLKYSSALVITLKEETLSQQVMPNVISH